MTDQRTIEQRLADLVAALPRDVAPPDDLWVEVARRLAPRRAGAPPVREHSGRWRLGRFPAAAAVIVAVAIGSSAVTVMVMRQQQGRTAAAPPAQAVSLPVASTLPARFASLERDFARSVTYHQRVLDQRRDSLAPSTVATVERSLRVADSAIAEARAALARDPGNRTIAAIFASNYERKIDLLRRASELAPRT